MPLKLYYYLQLTAIFIMLGWTLYWVYRIGQLNNAPVAIMAIGAYLSAYAVLKWGWPFPVAFAFAVVCGAIFSFIPAIALGRAPAFSMVIATIALIFIMQTLFRNLPWFGRSLGLFGIPKIKNLLWITYGILIFFGILIYRFDHSRIGRAADMVFVDRDVASTLGVNFYLFSVCLQAITGVIGAICGVLYAFTIRTVIPVYFGFPFLMAITTFIFVGGYTTMWGVVVFTPLLWGIPLILPENMAVFRNFIYGALLMGTIILRSEGVIDRRFLKKLSMRTRLIFGSHPQIKQTRG
jgi:branched-chain amino acid transport system permease protein